MGVRVSPILPVEIIISGLLQNCYAGRATLGVLTAARVWRGTAGSQVLALQHARQHAVGRPMAVDEGPDVDDHLLAHVGAALTPVSRGLIVGADDMGRSRPRGFHGSEEARNEGLEIREPVGRGVEHKDRDRQGP